MLTIEEINKLPFVFILGRGRSGTTLLQTMLDANPHVILPFESRLIIYLKKKYFHVVKWNESIIEEFIEDLYKEKRFYKSWHVDKELLRKKINLFPLHLLSFSSLCKIVYLSFTSPFDKQEILLVGDKNPVYSMFIPDLKEVFPNAKFIHLIRDYRDNIASNKKVFSMKNVALLAYAWKNFNIMIDKEKQKNKLNFYTIKYEDLATFPEKYIIEICDFLAIKFYPEMLNFYKKVNYIYEHSKLEAIEKLHSNMLNPINTTQINKWGKELSGDEIEIADYIAGSYAKKYGYNPVGQSRKIKYFIKSISGAVRYKFDNLVVKTYYKLPFYIRDLIQNIFNKFYIWFGYTNYYNSDDYRFNKKTINKKF